MTFINRTIYCDLLFKITLGSISKLFIQVLELNLVENFLKVFKVYLYSIVSCSTFFALSFYMFKKDFHLF